MEGTFAPAELSGGFVLRTSLQVAQYQRGAIPLGQPGQELGITQRAGLLGGEVGPQLAQEQLDGRVDHGISPRDRGWFYLIDSPTWQETLPTFWEGEWKEGFDCLPGCRLTSLVEEG